jgi:uncharacterized damage-inducible protein DinB
MIHKIVANLARAQKQLLCAADTIPAEQWKIRPGEGRWSASELTCHLVSVERAVLSGADRLLQKPPVTLPFFKRWHLPMALVEVQLIKRKTPIPLDAENIRGKEDMLAELRHVRERTLAFIEETRGRDLSKYHMPHPFLGTLNTYEWLQMIASHEIRHTKQMNEIAASLLKNVTILQK